MLWEHDVAGSNPAAPTSRNKGLRKPQPLVFLLISAEVGVINQKPEALGGTCQDKIEETEMPYVNIKITDEGVTKEQKAALIEGVTNLLREVLNKNPAT